MPWVILLQRPGEEQTLAGIDVRGELLRLGWSGMLTSIVLPFVDLDVAEQECGGERFGPFLVSLLTNAWTQQLTGDRCGPKPEPSPRMSHEGVRTVNARVIEWRR